VAKKYNLMKSKTESIILSSMNLGEADKLVTFFSIDRGLQKGVAKNARKSFRRFGAAFEAFTTCRLYLHEREFQDLIRIESADILFQPRMLCTDLYYSAAGSVMLELVKELAPLHEPNSDTYALLSQAIALLENGEDPLFLLRIFEIKLLSLLGYQPKLDYCLSCNTIPKGTAIFLSMKGGVVCSDCMVSSGDAQFRISRGSSGFYYQALRMDMEKISRLKPSPEIMQELGQAFSSYLIQLMNKRLKSMEFLRAVYKEIPVSAGERGA